MCAEGVKQGAQLIVGGKRVARDGFFFEPTIFAVNDDNLLAREEVFGPVMCVFKFDSIEEAIERANASEYGLAAAVFTRDLDTATTVALALRAGVVWVNCYDILEACVPFGGYKSSGIGRELGEAGLHQYSESKTITIALGAQKNT
jgi:aldehyde dehydrogenase (NAD+)